MSDKLYIVGDIRYTENAQDIYKKGGVNNTTDFLQKLQNLMEEFGVIKLDVSMEEFGVIKLDVSIDPFIFFTGKS